LEIELENDYYLTYVIKALQSLVEENKRENRRSNIKQEQDEDLFNQAQRLLQAIIIRLGTKYGLQTMENPKIESAIKYIEENYAENISNTDIAEALHIDTRYFIRLFKKYVGISPYQYLTQCRIEHAIDELRQDKSVTETAQLCGYQNENAFRIAFKRVMGCSPTAFFK
jgi:AraC-like DNA-binding protein